MSIQLEMPRLSETVTGGTIKRWIKKPGDDIHIGDHVADINTDETVFELLATVEGRLVETIATEGSTIQAGQPLASMEPVTRAYTSTPEPPASKADTPSAMSPLARKMAAANDIDVSSLRGTGPHGRIMAADLTRPGATRDQYPIAKMASQEQRIISPVTRVEDYFIFTLEANMSQLAQISIPIAVQSEKLLGGRYCLFDYVARAAVKAFATVPETLNNDGDIDCLMVVNKGSKGIALPQAVKKTIYAIAHARDIGEPEGSTSPVPPNYAPNLLVCDAGATIRNLPDGTVNGRPMGYVILGGTSPKTGIEAGRPIHKLMLPLTLYVDSGSVKAEMASRVAAEFKALMENPVLLLF